jgi:Putative zinc-finger
MNHRDVEEHQTVDRYLMGRLDAEEAARFEEHYLGCAECLDRLELAEAFQQGLRQVAAEDLAKGAVLRRAGLVAWLVRSAGSRRPGLLATALLLAVVLPLGFLYQRERTARSALADRLEEALAPQANVPIVPLGSQRGAPGAEAPGVRIRLPDPPGWIVLALELPDPAAFDTYRATLVGAQEAVVWESPPLVPDQRGDLVLSLHSSWLAAGDYALRVDGLREGAAEPVPAARYGFRVVP